MKPYQLYEKSSFAVELGAGIHLTPNGNGILRRWGIFAEEFGGTLLNRRFEFHYNGEPILDEDLTTPNLRWEYPWHLVHRVALHERLKRAATGDDGLGLPAILHTSSEVVHVSPERGKITLADGSVIEADVIIGADGVHVSVFLWLPSLTLFNVNFSPEVDDSSVTRCLGLSAQEREHSDS